MSFTQQQYEELKAAIAEGATTVTYSGAGQSKSVTYRSLDEMIRILRLMEKELGIGDGAIGGRTYASFSKGFFPRKPSGGCC